MKQLFTLLSFFVFNGLLFTSTVWAQAGANDSTFNTFDDGTYGDGTNNTVFTTALQPDGKVIIGGQFTTYNGTARNCIARLNADGSLDATFNPGSGADGTVLTTALQPDGKVIIGGFFTTYNGTARNRIARLNADGSLDATFNPGSGASHTVRTIALQPDGKVIIGGNFTTYNGTARARMARLNADGSLDATFNPGLGADGTVRTIALQPDGKVIIGGDFTMAEQGSYMVDITVLDSTAKSYTIQWAYRDYNLGSDNPVVQKLADMYRDMTIKVKTDEMGAITEVINWKELRDETNRFYKALMKDMKELNELPGFKAMMDRTIKTFSTKEAIESLAVADIQQFHSFYGAAYTLNEELKGRMKVPNFLGGEPFDSDITVVMEELNVEDGNYVLRMTEQVDKDQLTKATLAYVQGMAKSMGVDMPKAEDLGSLEHLVQLATRMHESGWPLYSVHTKTINGEGVEQIEERIIELITE